MHAVQLASCLNFFRVNWCAEMTIVRSHGKSTDDVVPEEVCEPSTPKYLLDLKLYPQRSLKPEHFSKLLLILIAICTLASIRFVIAGAWPVVLFLGLDVLALWFAFFLSYRRGRIFETVQLSDTDLIIGKSDASGRFSSMRFEPYWAKVSIRTVGGDANILTISHHDKCVELGSFLVPHERREVANAIRDAVERWKSR